VLLRWCALLPTYAAVAAHQGLGLDLELDDADLRASLAEIEDFALGGLLAGLARGATRNAELQQELLERLSGYTGLPVSELRRHRARVPASRFAKVFLAERRRLSASTTDP
jgi:hypothetical protein